VPIDHQIILPHEVDGGLPDWTKFTPLAIDNAFDTDFLVEGQFFVANYDRQILKLQALDPLKISDEIVFPALKRNQFVLDSNAGMSRVLRLTYPDDILTVSELNESGKFTIVSNKEINRLLE
jgi:hypothetical protein